MVAPRSRAARPGEKSPNAEVAEGVSGRHQLPASLGLTPPNRPSRVVYNPGQVPRRLSRRIHSASAVSGLIPFGIMEA